MQEYTRRTNTHRFVEVAELIAPEAVFWFNDGSFRGLDEIQVAFERTWQTIQDEQFYIEGMDWIVEDEQSAVCIYSFNWQGLVNGKPEKGSGRGTSVLKKVQGRWLIIHEHLSRLV